MKIHRPFHCPNENDWSRGVPGNSAATSSDASTVKGSIDEGRATVIRLATMISKMSKSFFMRFEAQLSNLADYPLLASPRGGVAERSRKISRSIRFREAGGDVSVEGPRDTSPAASTTRRLRTIFLMTPPPL